MLVLSRKKNESIVVAEGLITITVIEIRGDKVRLGIDAPKDVAVNRSEIHEIIQRHRAEDGAVPSVHVSGEVDGKEHRPDESKIRSNTQDHVPIDLGRVPDASEPTVGDSI